MTITPATMESRSQLGNSVCKLTTYTTETSSRLIKTNGVTPLSDPDCVFLDSQYTIFEVPVRLVESRNARQVLKNVSYEIMDRD